MGNSQTHIFMKPLLSLFSILLASSSVVSAAVYAVTATGSIQFTSGTDTLGLNGAQFTVVTSFADGVYIDTDGFPVAIGDPATTFITIAGATNPNANGTFSHYSGSTAPEYYPTSSGLYGGGADNYNLYFDLGIDSAFIALGLNTAPTTSGAAVSVGDTIEESHFSNGGAIVPRSTTIQTFFNAGYGSDFDSFYDVSGGTMSVQVIPEASVALLGGLGGLVLLRRRR